MTTTIKPGSELVSVISANSGGVAEVILRKIAGGFSTDQVGLSFSSSGDGEWTGQVTFKVTGETRPLALVLGRKEGLFLEDAPESCSCSMKDARQEGDIWVLSVGRYANVSPAIWKLGTRREYTDRRLDSLARNIISTWVLHGRNWTDRADHLCIWPYGDDSRRKEEKLFVVVDAGYKDISGLPPSCIRTTHVGSWHGANPEEVARTGRKVLMHEFMERAYNEGHSVCHCVGVRISDDENLWPGSARWSSRTLPESLNHGLPGIALRAASPFAFHVAATKVMFPQVELASAFLFRSLGEERLRRVLKEISNSDPSRFYRLIDEKGETHRFLSADSQRLFFEGNLSFPLSEAVDNVITSFVEMAGLDADCTCQLPARKRLVLDVHFYIVLTSLLTAESGVASILSGRDMSKYLFTSASSKSHAVRNERLFRLLAPIFRVDRLRLEVYRSVDPVPGKPDQYA